MCDLCFATVELREALGQAATATLRRIARAHGLSGADSSTRAELVERLCERLQDVAYLTEQLRRLDDARRRVLLEARANASGELRGALIERAYPGAAAALAELGLLFRVFTTDGPLRGEVFAVPDEILQLLPPPADPVPALPTASEPRPADRRASDPVFSLFALASALSRGADARQLERELRSWSEEPGGWHWQRRWQFLRQLAAASGLLASSADGGARGLLARTTDTAERSVHSHSADGGAHGLLVESADHPASGLGAPSAERLASGLAAESAERLASGLAAESAERRSSGLAAAATPHVNVDAGASPSLARLLDRPAELTERLWRAYVATSWSELAEAGVPHGAASLTDARLLRQAIVDAVQRLPADGWVSTVDFVGWLRRTRPAFIREQLDTRALAELGALDWSELEARLLRFVLLGPFYWLGLIAASADGALIQRRSSPASRSGSSAHTAASPAEPCSWAAVDVDQLGRRDDAEWPGRLGAGETVERVDPAVTMASPGAANRKLLLAPARTRLGTLLRAERYVVLQERGRVSRYWLDQAHVAAALAGGGSITDCRRLLIGLTQAELPADVAERLSTWERGFGSIVLRPAVLLEARSAADLDRATGDERLRPLLRARLGPTAADVPAAEALELAARLRERGHLPRVDAALRIGAQPGRAYAGLVDEQVLEFLLVSLLAFQHARPDRLADLEGSLALLHRLERLFPPERLEHLRSTAERLAGELASAPGRRPTRSPVRRRRGWSRRSGKS